MKAFVFALFAAAAVADEAAPAAEAAPFEPKFSTNEFDGVDSNEMNVDITWKFGTFAENGKPTAQLMQKIEIPSVDVANNIYSAYTMVKNNDAAPEKAWNAVICEMKPYRSRTSQNAKDKSLNLGSSSTSSAGQFLEACIDEASAVAFEIAPRKSSCNEWGSATWVMSEGAGAEKLGTEMTCTAERELASENGRQAQALKMGDTLTFRSGYYMTNNVSRNQKKLASKMGEDLMVGISDSAGAALTAMAAAIVAVFAF